MALFRTKSEPTAPLKVPNHLAIVMDGNGRWAKKRLLPRVMGHKSGMDTVKRITIAANDLGVKVLTLYTFSTENWRRPATEVAFLMDLPVTFFDKFVPELVANGIRVQTMGDTAQLPAATQAAIARAVDQTKAGTAMVLNFAINYGGQADIVQATQILAQQVADGKLPPAAIDQTRFEQTLATQHLGDYGMVDLMIRTSGELRISNFMPYQLAYAELYFTDRLWPDFDATDLRTAFAAFGQRDRRFGGVTTEEKDETS